MEDKSNIGYYAIIPAYIRYNKNLKFAEKLMYGEIAALSAKKGYCFASNAYFANLYGVNKNTVSRWISHLEKIGSLRIEIVRDSKKAIIERKIYIIDNPYILNNQYPYVENNTYPILKNNKDNNISNNINNNNNNISLCLDKNRGMGEGGEEKQGDTTKVDYEAFVGVYNATHILQVKKIIPKRKTAILKFTKDYNLDDFKKVCAISQQSEFLSGKNENNWIAGFDWLIKTDNATKVLEGQYGGVESRNKENMYDILEELEGEIEDEC